MADVIEDSVEWLDAVQSTKVENLSVLACGKRPKNPSELLTSRRFAELLEAFREKFELVIIDTPPVMAVTDPLNVAPRVDGVLLVLRLTKNARGIARRTLDALEEVGGSVLGVVVNGVGQGERYGSYGYNKYGYGYSNGYAYGGKDGYGYGGGKKGYGYGYGYGDDRTYYVDDADEETKEAAQPKPHNGNGKV
jgi:Mrp family chromosome partitioning ATPase